MIFFWPSEENQITEPSGVFLCVPCDLEDLDGMEELVTGDEAVLRTVALVVHNLRPHVEGLEDLEEALDHAVTPREEVLHNVVKYFLA